MAEWRAWNVQQGLFSARPAAAATNKGYGWYATDTGAHYRSDGSTWHEVGGGIQFDTYPQTGGYLWVRTTGESIQGYGIGLRSESSFQGIELWADNEDTTPNEIQVGALDSYGVGIAIFGKKGMFIENSSGGDFFISNSSADGLLKISSSGGGDGIRIQADTDLSVSAGDTIGISANDALDITSVGDHLTMKFGASHMFRIKDSAGVSIFEVHADWSVHIKTGQTVQADL